MPTVDYPNRFYLGRIFDHTRGETTDEPYLYDPDDLTTHAVVVGMTGSGKTGLCIDLMEEAALNNLPAILIDPKGDITNLLLHFPELRPSDFEPWINPDEARRDGKTVAQAAADTAALWRNGLESWGIGPDRIRRLRDAAVRTIYTPGSTAGNPISILASLRAPQVDWSLHLESVLEQIEGTVTALLGLIGNTNPDPVGDPEHILLSKIIEAAWRDGRDVELGELIMQTQNPPFDKIGFFAVDQFFPPKDRMALAMRLNNLVAAPSFQPWITGEPLDIQSLLYAPDGRPRQSVFYIAHLSDTERMFIVTLLYSAIETWMRSQAGTTSLRALVYFDEIFGYLPPTANPPSKKPMLRMLKQARAFGVGMVLATQNPVDIDYKALSNAGTWYIGRLQTERDKMRLLDGLQGATGGAFDRATADRMLSGLGKRVFLVNNVHEKDGPQLFQTRWAMNYLAGPMTRTQIQALNALAGSEPVATPVTTGGAGAGATLPTRESAAEASTPLDDYTQTRPAVPNRLDEYFLPQRKGVSEALRAADRDDARDVERHGIVYLPSLLLQADVTYTDRRGSFSEDRRYTVVLPADAVGPRVRFADFEVEPIDPRSLDRRPDPDARFAELGSALSEEKVTRGLGSEFSDFIYREKALELFENRELKLTSEPGEPRAAFVARCEDAADKLEDEEVDKIKERYETKLDRLRDKLRDEERELSEDEAKLAALKRETLVRHAETIYNIASSFLGGGRRRVSGVSTALRKQRMQADAKMDVEESEAEIAELKQDLVEMQREQEEALEAIDRKWAEIVQQIETVRVSPFKKYINIELMGIAWRPHWLLSLDGRVRRVAAD